MIELLAAPALLWVSIGALGLAVLAWTATALGLGAPAVRRRLRVITAVAIAVALLIIAARFLVLGA